MADHDLPPDAPDDLVVEDDDFLDHPDVFEEDDLIVDLDTELFFPLFPEGVDDGRSGEWQALFTTRAPLTATPVGTAYSGSGRDTGIAGRLRAYGLKVQEVAGWQTRGSATFHPRGSIDHHTASGLSGNAPSLGICTNGRSDLPGPLCQVLIGRDNTCYVIAAGRANHAGTGSYAGVTGNSNVYGVEHENTGIGNEPWREDQRLTAAKVHAALLDGRRGGFVCQHKEWTSRKIDKWDQSGPDMRSRVAKAWTTYDNGEDDMSMFPTDQAREDFVKAAYRDIAGREPESVETVNAWKWKIATQGEYHALILIAALHEENRLAQDGRIQTANTKAMSAGAQATAAKTTADAAMNGLNKLTDRVEHLENSGGGGGITMDQVIANLTARLQS